MVRDVRGSEWPFIRFQKLGLSSEIPRVVLDSLETDRGLFCVALCVDMLLLCLNNMLLCVNFC